MTGVAPARMGDFFGLDKRGERVDTLPPVAREGRGPALRAGVTVGACATLAQLVERSFRKA